MQIKKQLIIIATYSIFLSLASTNSYSEDNTSTQTKSTSSDPEWYISYSSDGDNIDNNTSYGAGVRGQEFGLELVLFGDEFTRSVLNYRVPHSNYSILSSADGTNYKQQSKFGIDLKKYFNVNPNLSVSIGGGLYTWTREKVAISNVTGWYYSQDKKSEYKVSGLAGLQFMLNDYSIGVETHNIRGLSLHIGSNF